MSPKATVLPVESREIQLSSRPVGRPTSENFRLAAELEIALPALDRDTAEELMAKAHQICPYSNATRGNMAVDLKLVEFAA
jgi:organic hydroperoxide reductase OsmC/OhrA